MRCCNLKFIFDNFNVFLIFRIKKDMQIKPVKDHIIFQTIVKQALRFIWFMILEERIFGIVYLQNIPVFIRFGKTVFRYTCM